MPDLRALLESLPVRGVWTATEFHDGTSELYVGETLVGQIDTPYAEAVVQAMNAILEMLS